MRMSTVVIGPWYSCTCIAAAEGGHLECLEYAHGLGCELNADTCRAAAEGGHLECLKYAHEQGCEWNADTCRAAAEGGHLECLKYAHEQGCEWHNCEIFMETAQKGYRERLKRRRVEEDR